MRNRQQRGYIYRKNKRWFVRYYDNVIQEDGSIKRVQLAHPIALTNEYPRKADVRPLVAEFLLPINSGLVAPEGTMKLAEFVHTVYLPHVEQQLKPSTANGYRDAWNRHFKHRCCGIRLRDFRTRDGELLLQDIACSGNLSRTTLKHLKALLSGVFKHAKRIGAINGVNPVQDVSIPKGKEPADTYAYSLEEVEQMLSALPSKAGVIVAMAAFTGARRGEIRGLRWQDYSGTDVRVMQSVWRRQITAPKTRKSTAAIPVIAPLAQWLEMFRSASGNPQSGLIFKSRTNTPLDLADLSRRVIRPALENTGVAWHGWHAFRRGLATNLYRLGVPDKVIQTILRHANISTTLNSYVKGVPADAVDAMNRLSELCTKHAPSNDFVQEYVM